LSSLFDQLNVDRVTLRRHLPGERAFPVTDEICAPGVIPIIDERTIVTRTSPVAIEAAAGRQVVQNDSAAHYLDDSEFHRMRHVYGGLAAQIVTPFCGTDV
jgi:hypothetical protein